MIESLTPREIEIIQLGAEGADIKETARLLFLAAPTVKVHRSNIIAKLNAKNFMHCVGIYYQEKLAALNMLDDQNAY